VVRDDYQTSTRVDESAVRVCLENVRGGETGPRIHAVNAHEHQVQVNGAQRRHGERTDEGI
jgi:hypothetical protein